MDLRTYHHEGLARVRLKHLEEIGQDSEAKHLRRQFERVSSRAKRALRRRKLAKALSRTVFPFAVILCVVVGASLAMVS